MRLEADLDCTSSFADALPCIIWTADANGLLTYVNKPWSEYTGVSVEQSLGQTWGPLVHSDDQDRLSREWAAATLARIEYVAEARIRRASDSVYRWHLIRAIPLIDDAGNVRKYFGTTVDIDAQKRAERLSSRILDGSDDSIVVVDDDGRIVSINDRGRAMLEVNAEQPLEGSWWLSLWDGVDRVAARRSLKTARDGETAKFSGLLRTFLTKKPRWYDIVMTPLRDEDGRADHMLATMRDVTERVRGEQALRLIADVSLTLAGSLEYRDMLERIAYLTVDSFADYCVLDLLDENGFLNRVAWAHNDEQLRAGLANDKTTPIDDVRPHPAATVARTGRSMLVATVTEEFLDTFSAGPRHAEQLRLLDIGSMMIVPIEGRSGPAGALVFSTDRRNGRRYTNSDLAVAEEIGRRVGLAVEHAQTYERERHVAQTLQRAMLPASLPVHARLAFDATYVAGRREALVGGDWYDAFVVGEASMLLSIGDVCGSGLQAAVEMGAVRQAVRVLAQLETSPRAILNAVDRSLRGDRPDVIVTAFLGILDTRTLEFTYASAGHPPPLLRHADGTIEEVTFTDLPLGMRDGHGSLDRTIALEPGDLLVLYTDGLTESTRNFEEGERRLRAALATEDVALADHPASVLHDVVLFDGAHDDVAILTVRIA